MLKGLTAGTIIFIVVLVISLMILVPFGLIWSINILFDLSNPYDFIHWLAGFLFVMLLAGNTGNSNNG